MKKSPRYIELAVTTNFSFLRGASHPGELAVAAAQFAMPAIGVADRNSLAGVVRAYDALQEMECEGEKPRLLAGARLVFEDGTPDILAYPQDRAAYGNLCRLISEGKLRAEKGDCKLSFADLVRWQEGLLLALIPPKHPEDGRDALQRLREAAPGRVWLAAAMLYHGDDRRRLRKLQRLAREACVPLLAINDVLYHVPERRELQDVVTCIREHVSLYTAGRLLEANAERHLKPTEEMVRLFAEVPEAVAETERFAARITFSLRQLKYNYPDEPVPPGKTAQQHLEDVTWEGAAKAYPQGVPEKVRAVLVKELALIAKLEYAPYFLTVRDIVGFAKKRDILCQGRGSAANSAVCFVLGITGVDPNEVDVLFERFISQERKEPPDIDVDFEHERREEVIQDVYARYGRAHAALTATVICYRPRSAIREVGKAFGLTEDVTAALASGVWGSWGNMLKEKEVKQSAFDPQNAMIARALRFANELLGFPRHLSQHVGGFVLTRDRLDTIVPIGPAAMEDRYFIEWDKDDIDRLGMMKVDVLALGMLTCIRKAFELIAAFRGRALSLAAIPREDPVVYDMLCKADAIGVFQVESRAQMNMLPRLKPRTFYDLVIEVAIVRPGPIQGDMVHPYLRRRSGKEAVTFPSPAPEHGPADELFKVLGRTMGVPLFQEQAMKLAIVAAKFTPEEANGLRRAMATFRNVGTIDRFRDKMVEGMVTRGYERDFAERCFKQIEGFGSYGFPESHAASFAHLVYVSAWIKCHYPAEFACALLNSQPMGFYAPAEIVRDAREHGVEVRHADINFSTWHNTLEGCEDGALALRLGFRQITGFREEWGDALSIARHPGRDALVTASPWGEADRVSERVRGSAAGEVPGADPLTPALSPGRGGSQRSVTDVPQRARGDVVPFTSAVDLVRRAKLPARAMHLLAEADAFRSVGQDRREALWAVRHLADEAPLPLFAAAGMEEQPPERSAPLPLMPLSEHVLSDYRIQRLSLKGYPTEFLREVFRAEKIVTCADVGTAKEGQFVRCAGIVLVRQMPGTAGVVFITLSDETGIANVVVWPAVFERFRREVMGAKLLLVSGRIQRSEEGVVHLVSEGFSDRTYELGRLSPDEFKVATPVGDIPPPPDSRRHPRDMRLLPKSRDFH